MDDCDEEILPGILQDTGTYEFRQAKHDRLHNFSSSYEHNLVWELKDLQFPYFDLAYSPYVYHGRKSGEALYKQEFTTDAVSISDPHFKDIIQLNTLSLLNHVRASVLVYVADEFDDELGVTFNIGVGQFIPVPTVVSITGSKSGIYCKKTNKLQSNQDGLLQKLYDGNIPHWKILGRLQDYHKKSSRKEWPITELNRLLPDNYTSVTTIDILNKFLHIVDFCGNVDFYIWMGGCTEFWLLWPERRCQAIEYEMLMWTQQEYEETNRRCTVEETIKKFQMYLGTPDNVMKRPNVYLGTSKEAMKLCKPFATSVSNGTFTLAEECFH